MNSIKRLGILYGRLGLATDAALIEKRSVGVAAVSDGLELKNVPLLVRVAFSLPKAAESADFLEKFGEEDPTFDVQATDREASLLAASILDYHIENEGELSPMVALMVMATAAGGLRRPVVHDTLLGEAESMLAYFQGQTLNAPEARRYNKQPDTIAPALTAIGQNAGNYFNSVAGQVVTAIQEVGKYAEANALAAARSDNLILSYIGRVEKELQVFWWVSSGWSSGASKPFRKLSLPEATLRAGVELAEKAYNETGLFAAPAMFDMLLERGRLHDDMVNISIKAAAIAGDQSWRRRIFEASGGACADLLPISTALGMAADSADADDWQPRFERVTGVPPSTEFDPISLGLQLYREQLVAKALA